MNKSLKICLISEEYPPTSGTGGIGTYTHELAKGLNELGHKVYVITKSMDNDAHINTNGIDIYRIPDKPMYIKGLGRIANITTRGLSARWWHSKCVFSLINKIVKQNGKFDIIEGPLWDSECCAFPKGLSTPLIIRLQTPIFKTREILKLPPSIALQWLEKYSLNKATLIIAISQNISDLIINKYGIDRNKIICSPLGVTTPKINEPIFNKNSYKLLYVGRLEERKGITDLINALPKILFSNKKITVDIVGKDCSKEMNLSFSYYQYFKNTVPAKLQNRVKFHSYIEKAVLNQLYRECDVFIAPSLYESFGLVYLEAMVYGKPVIGTKTGGIPEVVRDGKVGLLVDINKPDKISLAVLSLFNNESLRKKMGENAFSYSRDKYSYEIMTQDTLKVYYRAINLYSNYQE